MSELRNMIDFYMIEGAASDEGAQELLSAYATEEYRRGYNAALREAADIQSDLVRKRASRPMYYGSAYWAVEAVDEMSRELRRMATEGEGEL